MEERQRLGGDSGERGKECRREGRKAWGRKRGEREKCADSAARREEGAKSVGLC